MTLETLLNERLHNQYIAGPQAQSVSEVITRLGAIQAQDYPGALWTIGLRLPGSTKDTIEQAISERKILRTWPMRGTLHFVAPENIRWMLPLTAHKVIQSIGARYRNLELDAETFQHSGQLFEAALQGNKQLSRSAMYQLLEEAGISAAGQRGPHILSHHCQKGLLCFAAHIGKEPSFALLEEWVPYAPQKSREEALAALVQIYFTGHGPATIEDFMWWSGLTKTETKAGLAMNTDTLSSEEFDGRTYWFNPQLSTASIPASSAYLLPGFDEYMLGYTNRSLILAPEHSPKIVPGNNGIFLPTLVLDGRVQGLWKRATTPKKTRLTLQPFAELNPVHKETLEAQARRYGEFTGIEVELTLVSSGLN